MPALCLPGAWRNARRCRSRPSGEADRRVRPGLANPLQETQTAEYLADKLEQSGYAVQRAVGITGIVAVLDSGFPGPTLGFRADMDALGHEKAGQVIPIHSCGHDAHSAIVITLAEEDTIRENCCLLRFV